MSTLTEQSANTAKLENVLSTVDISPEAFLQSSSAIHAASLVAAKRLLDPVIADYSSFTELALRGLDTEQVWEQIRLVSEQVKSVVESRGGLKGDTKSGSVNGIKDLADNQGFGDEDELEDDSMDEEDEEESLDEDEDMEDDEENSMDEDEGDESDDNEFSINPEREESDVEETTTSKPFKKDIHGLNDEFFSIDDFNRLTEQQDAERSNDENADEIDYFAGPRPGLPCTDH
jgi:U3 small nucleolar RNA-associated protein MPP10